jgi:hypothetical protein
VKNSVLALLLVAAGCAEPQQQQHTTDLATVSGVGGGGGGDMAVGDAGEDHPSGGDDLSMSDSDLSMTMPPDMAVPPPPPDMATPRDLATPPDMTECKHNTTTSTCGLFPQCGCAAGQMCNVQDGTGKALCEVAGTTPPFGTCTGTGAGTCAAGTTCVNGVCSPYCGTNTDCPNGVCVQVGTGPTTPIPGVKVCTLNCDPLHPNTAAGSYGACGTGASCVPRSDHNTVCASPTKASGTQDASCSKTSDCAPGFTCESVGWGGTYCSAYCRSTADCTGNTQCRVPSTRVYDSASEIGFCY